MGSPAPLVSDFVSVSVPVTGTVTWSRARLDTLERANIDTLLRICCRAEELPTLLTVSVGVLDGRQAVLPNVHDFASHLVDTNLLTETALATTGNWQGQLLCR